MTIWLLLLGLASTAHGWSLGELRPLEVPEGAVDGTLLRWNGGPAVAWAGPGGLVLAPTSGGEGLTAKRPLVRLAVADLDADGGDDLVLCGPDGLALLRAVDGQPVPLGDRACDDVVAVDTPGGWPELLVRSGESLFRWTAGKEGVEEVPVDGLALAPVGLGAHAMGWAAVDTEGGLVLRSAGRELRGPGGAVKALAWGPDGWTWWAEGEVRSAVRSTEAPSGATGMAGARLGGRDTLLFALGSAKVAVWADGVPPTHVVLPVAAEALRVGEATGDGCPDWLAWGASGAVVVEGACAYPTEPAE